MVSLTKDSLSSLLSGPFPPPPHLTHFFVVFMHRKYRHRRCGPGGNIQSSGTEKKHKAQNSLLSLRTFFVLLHSILPMSLCLIIFPERATQNIDYTNITHHPNVPFFLSWQRKKQDGAGGRGLTSPCITQTESSLCSLLWLESRKGGSNYNNDHTKF